MKKTGRQIEKLFHQQCWCWGADIRNGEPNYLLSYGFVRIPRPCPDCGSSRYYLFRDGLHIHLWAFGAVWQREGGPLLCLKRYDRAPSLLSGERPPDCIHQVSEFEQGMKRIPRAEMQQYAADFSRFINFMAAYEAFVNRNAPGGYRASCVKGWPHKCMDGRKMEQAWRSLAEALPKDGSDTKAA